MPKQIFQINYTHTNTQSDYTSPSSSDLRTTSGWASLPRGGGGGGGGASPLGGRLGEGYGGGERRAGGVLCCWPLLQDRTACPQHPLTGLGFGRPFSDSVFEEKNGAEMYSSFICNNNLS